MNDAFRVLFEDQHLVVLSKAPGLLSQGDASGEASLVDLLRTHFGRNYVGLVHRLDRNTSGLMVVAKRSKSADRLSEQLRTGDLRRQYHAVLWGSFKDSLEVEWRHHLKKDGEKNEVRVVPEGTAGAQSASLRMLPLKSLIHPVSGDPLTLAKFTLDTGRSHQIRVQSAAAGHPLLGDRKYGSAKTAALFPRPALHSAILEFLHPMTKEKMSFEERYCSDMLLFFSTTLE
jgi:23S rRNA pseudouridine1911/1915/1917 synthase